MLLSCPWHPEHCSCTGIPPSWKLPIPLGAAADINLAALEGLVPELCPSAVPGLPQDLLQGAEGRGLWLSAGPISIGISIVECLPSAAGHGHLCSCSKHCWRQQQEWEQMGKRGESQREKRAGKKSRYKSLGGMAPHWSRQWVLQPRDPGSSSSSTVSVSPVHPLDPNFPITWQHSTRDSREG